MIFPSWQEGILLVGLLKNIYFQCQFESVLEIYLQELPCFKKFGGLASRVRPEAMITLQWI